MLTNGARGLARLVVVASLGGLVLTGCDSRPSKAEVAELERLVADVERHAMRQLDWRKRGLGDPPEEWRRELADATRRRDDYASQLRGKYGAPTPERPWK
jgi:hypothetical protein